MKLIGGDFQQTPLDPTTDPGFSEIEISGFPSGTAITYTDTDGTRVSIAQTSPTTTVVLNGGDPASALTTLSITSPPHTDKDFELTVTMTADTSNVNNQETYIHPVQVGAVADAPDVSHAFPPPEVDENSGFANYPVTLIHGDTDGSETTTVAISYSMPGIAPDSTHYNDPVFQFNGLESTTGLTVVRDESTNTLALTGTRQELVDALAALQIQPGESNGEDITVVIEATATESNPTETGFGQVAQLDATGTDTFNIEVNPLIVDTPAVNIPQSTLPQGLEDVPVNMGVLTVDGDSDSDPSEVRSIEIDAASVPPGSIFYVDGVEVTPVLTPDGYLFFNDTDGGEFVFEPPTGFSGDVELLVRGRIDDYTDDETVTEVGPISPMTVFIAPDSEAPSSMPSLMPSASPSAAPSTSPSASPSAAPSASPSTSPSSKPSTSPSGSPSSRPSTLPSLMPSASPSAAPSTSPSAAPSAAPSASPSTSPSASPSASPSGSPTARPSTSPSLMPSPSPSTAPVSYTHLTLPTKA